jgi:hypothetical protein
MPNSDHVVSYDRALSDRFEIYCLDCGQVVESVAFQ